jgi:hypothetical protein
VRWRTLFAAACLASAGLLAAAPAQAAAGDPGAESAFVSRINGERAGRRLPALTVAADLVAVARRHSADMAGQNRLYDNANLGREVGGWQSLGENVGQGGSVDSVHGAFMASSAHRANILASRFTEVGVGVVWSGKTLWVTEVFRQPMNGAPPPAPAPAAPPRAAPPPRPAPAPAPAAPAKTIDPMSMSMPMSMVVGQPLTNAVAPARLLLGDESSRPLRRRSHHASTSIMIPAAVLIGAAGGDIAARLSRRRDTSAR